MFCEVCKKKVKRDSLFSISLLGPKIKEILVKKFNSDANLDGFICSKDLRNLRTVYVKR